MIVCDSVFTFFDFYFLNCILKGVKYFFYSFAILDFTG